MYVIADRIARRLARKIRSKTSRPNGMNRLDWCQRTFEQALAEVKDRGRAGRKGGAS